MEELYLQAFVYAYGAVLIRGLEYTEDGGNTTGLLNASPELLSLLNLMKVRDPGTRPQLPRLAQVYSSGSRSVFMRHNVCLFRWLRILLQKRVWIRRKLLALSTLS